MDRLEIFRTALDEAETKVFGVDTNKIGKWSETMFEPIDVSMELDTFGGSNDGTASPCPSCFKQEHCPAKDVIDGMTLDDGEYIHCSQWEGLE